MGTRAHRSRLGSSAAILVLALAFVLAGGGQGIPGPKMALANPGAPAGKSVPLLYVPGQLIVKARSGVPAPALALAAPEAQIDRKLLGGVDLYRVPEGRESEAIHQLQASGLVEYAEYDYLRRATAEPKDPYFPLQWHLAKINLPAAWDVARGGGQAIAILDTGLEIGHPDLAGRIRRGANFTSENGGDGSNYADTNGHGTHVAGIASAWTNNGVGVSGVAWDSSLVVAKVLDRNGVGSDSQIIQALHWAAPWASIVNLSLGGNGYSRALADAVASVQSAWGLVIVAAMGNDGGAEPGQLANAISYPAALPKVIAVAATEQNDQRADFSNYHDHTWVSAPGFHTVRGGILSTLPKANLWFPGLEYGILPGTSMATPQVAGLAALIMSANRQFGAQNVRAILQQSAVDVDGPGWDQRTGWGRIDAGRAVRMTATHSAIKGRVLDNGERPVAGATVRSGDFQATTDASGNYALPVMAGQHAASVAASGAGAGPSRTVTVEQGLWTAADFILPPVVSVLANGGFENGSTSGWTFAATPAPKPRSDRFDEMGPVIGPGPLVQTRYARQGIAGVYFGYSEDLFNNARANPRDTTQPVDYTSHVRLSQTVVVPANAWLAFWYRMETVDRNPVTACSFDCFRVRLLNPSTGQVLATVLETHQGSGWRSVTHDASSLAGQAVTVEFWLANDVTLTSSVQLDEVTLGPLVGTFTPTSLPVRVFLPMISR